MKEIFKPYLFSLLLICFLTLSVKITCGQVHGVLRDSSARAIVYANCELANDSLKLLKNVQTDSLGTFMFKSVRKGIYTLKVSIIGYEPIIYRRLHLGPESDLGVMTLKLNSLTLAEVTIQGKKELLEHDGRKLIFNADQSLASSGNNTFELLQRIPGVTLDKQGSILKINGREGGLITVNGRQTYLSLPDLMNILQGMSANTISKVEVISNPSSDMDASGNGGIINIVLKDRSGFDKKRIGFSLTSGYGQGAKVGLNFNYGNNFKKLYYSFTYSGNYNNTREAMYVNRNNSFENTDFNLNTYSLREPVYKSHSATLVLSYDFSSKLRVNANAQYFNRLWKMDATNSYTVNHSSPSQLLDHERDSWSNILTGIETNYQYAKQGALTAGIDFLSYRNRNDHNYAFNGVDTSYSGKTNIIGKQTPIKIVVLNLANSSRLSKQLQIKFGLKGSFSAFTNTVLDYFQNNSDQTSIADLNGKDALSENILATYLTSDYEISKRIKVSAGLRYEHTSSKLVRDYTTPYFDNRYGNFFPAISFDYAFTTENHFHAGYLKRIQRPSFVDLAPFVSFVDPLTYVSGNSFLVPAIFDNFSIGFSSKALNLSLDYSNGRNNINYFQPRFNEQTNVFSLTPININNLKTVAFTASLPIKIENWWEANANSTYSYNSVKTGSPENIVLNKNSVLFNLLNSFSLSAGLRFETSFFLQTPSLIGLTQRQTYWDLSLSLQKKISKNSSLTFTANDIFNKNIWIDRNSLPVEDLMVLRSYKMETRILRISYKWSFGLGKIIDRGQVSEENRVN